MKKIKAVNKIAEMLINIGDTQANEASTLIAFYEPKISENIMRKKK